MTQSASPLVDQPPGNRPGIVADNEPSSLYGRLKRLESRIYGDRGVQEAGSASDALYREIFEFLPDSILIHCDGKIVYANPPGARLFGAACAEDLLGYPTLDIVHPDFRGAAEQRLRQVVEHGKAAEPTIGRRVGIDGRIFDVESRISPILWNGRPAVIAVSRDVTDRLASEDAVRESEERFALAIEGANEGIWDWDLDRGEFYMSPRLKELLGYADAEIANTFEAWSGLLHPEDAKAVERALVAHFGGETEYFEIETRLRHRSREYCWVFVRGKAVRHRGGSVRRIAGIQSDITGRRQAESALAEAQESATGLRNSLLAAIEVIDGIALFDAERRLVMCNEGYRRGYGLAASEVVPGRTLEEILNLALEQEVILDAVGQERQWLDRRLKVQERESDSILVRSSDGRWHQISERQTEDGGFIVLRMDVTKLKNTESELQKRIMELESTQSVLRTQSAQLAELAEQLHFAKEEADAANKTKSDFLANMSHELRTPLNAIMGFSEVIKDEMFGKVGQDQYIEYARDIYNSGAHLLEIISDILDLSKVESGKLQITEERFALPDIAEAVLRIVRTRAESAKIKLALEFSPNLPHIFGDKRSVKQMLLNLLSNAVKFTPEGGKVLIDGRINEDGAIVLSVSDNGIGIAEENLETVMVPFGQVDSALAREHHGTGLGLPLVKALIELHGGRLELSSEFGVGTTATLIFPPHRSIVVK